MRCHVCAPFLTFDKWTYIHHRVRVRFCPFPTQRRKRSAPGSRRAKIKGKSPVRAVRVIPCLAEEAWGSIYENEGLCRKQSLPLLRSVVARTSHPIQTSAGESQAMLARAGFCSQTDKAPFQWPHSAPGAKQAIRSEAVTIRTELAAELSSSFSLHVPTSGGPAIETSHRHAV